MASTLQEDVSAFLDEVTATMTNLHVKASQYVGQPDVEAAFGELTSVPGVLIAQAQQLRARLDAETDAEDTDEPDDKPKPKAKAKPSTASKRS